MCEIAVLVHRQSHCMTLTIQTLRENCFRHLSVLYLQRPLLPLHLTTRFTSAFPAAFVFTRSAATVSLSFFSPLSTSILSKPLAGAFNRQWHLSPRAVMSPIHQWADDGLYAPPPRQPPPRAETGGEGSHSTRPERLEGVCVVEADTHGHWIWTLNHRGLHVCVSPLPRPPLPLWHFLHIPRG